MLRASKAYLTVHRINFSGAEGCGRFGLRVLKNVILFIFKLALY